MDGQYNNNIIIKPRKYNDVKFGNPDNPQNKT